MLPVEVLRGTFGFAVEVLKKKIFVTGLYI
jgi:hypothetical protein